MKLVQLLKDMVVQDEMAEMPSHPEQNRTGGGGNVTL